MTKKRNFCNLCHYSPIIPDEETTHPECEESFFNPVARELWGQIRLPYFKQGDDYASVEVKKDDTINYVQSLRNLKHKLEFSANRLEVIASYLEKHEIDPKTIEITGDTHWIKMNGPVDVMRDLIKTGHVWFDGPYLDKKPE